MVWGSDGGDGGGPSGVVHAVVGDDLVDDVGFISGAGVHTFGVDVVGVLLGDNLGVLGDEGADGDTLGEKEFTEVGGGGGGVRGESLQLTFCAVSHAAAAAVGDEQGCSGGGVKEVEWEGIVGASAV